MSIRKNQPSRIQELKRKKFHPLLHHAHKKHRMSYKTLYYIKSYGQDKHVWHAIIKQSLPVIVFASILSTFGGFWLQSLQAKLSILLPLLVMIPALNSMVGNFGTIIGSKFSAYLFMGKVRGHWWKAQKLKELIGTMFVVAFIAAIYIAVMSSLIAIANGFDLTPLFFSKMLLLSILSAMLLGLLITSISIIGGLIIFKRGDDPNNFLIPLTTAVADLGSLTIFSLVVLALF